mgnify:CR=1 FL=1|tara:strand:- start:366 stop:554 length:189 start_codon:yes stop_codon:yes gene_type:complete
MNKLIAVLEKLAGKMLLSKKDKIIAAMNKKIDIPFADEEDEKEMLEGLWSVIEEAVKDGLSK